MPTCFWCDHHFESLSETRVYFGEGHYDHEAVCPSCYRFVERQESSLDDIFIYLKTMQKIIATAQQPLWENWRHNQKVDHSLDGGVQVQPASINLESQAVGELYIGDLTDVQDLSNGALDLLDKPIEVVLNCCPEKSYLYDGIDTRLANKRIIHLQPLVIWFGRGTIYSANWICSAVFGERHVSVGQLLGWLQHKCCSVHCYYGQSGHSVLKGILPSTKCKRTGFQWQELYSSNGIVIFQETLW